MSTHKIITIILIILAIFLGVSVYKQNKQGTLIVPTASVTTPSLATSTPIKISEIFLKQISLSSLNYFEFSDGTVLSLKQVNDSRCASNVNCIWAGNVIVIFNLKKGNANERFELKFGTGAENSQFTYGDYKIKIINIFPDKGVENKITTQKDYKVTILISK